MSAPPTALLNDGLVRQLIELGYANAETGAITGAGTVDNAAVNTAIEEDAAASRASLGLSDGSVTEGSFLRGASDGSVEEATPAQTATALRATPVGRKTVTFNPFGSGDTVATGDAAGGQVWRTPADYNGWEVVSVAACVVTAGTTGTTDVQIRRVRAATPADLLSTKITIDSGEVDSSTAAAAAVINTSNDDVATGDQWFVDVDAVSTTPPEGLVVEMTIQEPAA